MNKLILLCALVLQSFTCNTQSESTPPAITNDTLKKQEACNVLSKDEVATLLNAEVNKLISDDMSFMSNEKRSLCRFRIDGGYVSYDIHLGWKSEKAISMKTLEKMFSNYLTNGEKDMEKYKEIESSSNSQILYGWQKGRQGTNHIIRKRYGNSAALKIEIIRENYVPELENMLLEIVKGIQ